MERIDGFKCATASGPTSPVASPPAGTAADALTVLLRWLEALQKLELGVSADDTPWVFELRGRVLRNDLATWRALRSEAAQTVGALSDAVVADTRKVRVTGGRDPAEAQRDLKRLSEHYGAGGRRRMLGLLKPAIVRETEWVEQAVRLEGAPVRTPDELDHACRALEGWARLEAAWEVWARWPAERPASPRQQVAALRNRLATLDNYLELARELQLLPLPLKRWLADACPAPNSTDDLLAACQRRLAEMVLAGARAERDQLVSDLDLAIGSSDAVPAILQLPEALLSEDLDAARAARVGLAEETQRRELHTHYVTFLEAVAQSAPKLAQAIALDAGTDRWEERFRTFARAWTHRCASVWLATVLSRERFDAADRAARDESARAQDLLRDLAAARAWHAALQRIDDRARAALVGWTQAVANIPATGRSVFHRRAVARSYLAKCLAAIPAWVVSLGRLYETVEARPHMFDIAIVDEASQCWLDSLVLFYLARQVIIVGDDKQISPTVVGVNEDDVDALARAYLGDFEHRGNFTIGSSLFDHAQRYLAAGVPLQEHFRCVPEIIRFSNELCYLDKPLIPLRQCGRDRLELLKTTYLSNGLRHGDVNDAEAKAIVDTIVACHSDEGYEEADFGVICLQGDDQAARIQQLLLERLGPGVFEKRNLRCGNPYAFQGDERSVIFLSMVAAPNADNAPLTRRMYEQRFNVALSRARDQAWLFHSIREADLSPNCLRRRVLRFFYQPPDLSIHGAALDIAQLRLVAARADRRTERPPAPFESWFELDVALALSARGHTVSAQVRVASRRIDLVIEGAAARLAVECDGEAWHGPEQFANDMFRQRQLERAGWRFARVRESLFYSDRDRAIAEVLAACGELGIDPREHRGAFVAEPTSPYRAEAVPEKEPPTGAALTEPETDRASLARRRDEEIVDEESEQPSGAPYSTPAAGGTVPEITVDDERDGPFSGYGGKDYPNPRTAPPANIRDAVLDIVRTDGPLPKASIYRLYREGCPRVEKAGKTLRQAVNRAVAALERGGLVESRDEGGHRDPADVVVKLASQPWVDSRPPGRRGLDDVPLSELAAAMSTISGPLRPASEDDRLELYRTVARKFNVRRLRTQWLPRFDLAARLAFPQSDDGPRAAQTPLFEP